MTINQNAQATLEVKIKGLTEDNDLLLNQLFQVQEELERGYLHSKEVDKVRSLLVHDKVDGGKGWVDEELPDALSEIHRLQALVEAHRQVHRLEMQNGLNVKLGDILIQGVDSLPALVSVPTKVGKIWLESRRQLPPKSIGGKNFDKVVAAYREGGFASVEQLMTEVAVSAVMWANAYTALARQLMASDRAMAAEAAHRAYALDPKPYRLKWFAFRLHEAGRFVEAEALLDIVSPETQFSESEARQANQLRLEARHFRQNEAKRKTGFTEKRAELEKQLKSMKFATESWAHEKVALLSGRDEMSALAEDRGREVEVLRLAIESLEQEKLTLSSSREEWTALAERRGREVETLKLANESLDLQAVKLLDSQQEMKALAEERGREAEVLRLTMESLEQEKSRLITSREEATARAEEQAREVEMLRLTMESLEQEKSRLITSR
ncbi:hypothetical protein BZM26_34035, partial [Paraburkholderia strydomiana]